MGPGGGIVGVGAVSAVDDGAEAVVVFGEGGVVDCFAATMLGEPDRLGFTVGKAGHGVFPGFVSKGRHKQGRGLPITDVIVEVKTKHFAAPIIAFGIC